MKRRLRRGFSSVEFIIIAGLIAIVTMSALLNPGNQKIKQYDLDQALWRALYATQEALNSIEIKYDAGFGRSLESGYVVADGGSLTTNTHQSGPFTMPTYRFNGSLVPEINKEIESMIARGFPQLNTSSLSISSQIGSYRAIPELGDHRLAIRLQDGSSSTTRQEHQWLCFTKQTGSISSSTKISIAQDSRGVDLKVPLSGYQTETATYARSHAENEIEDARRLKITASAVQDYLYEMNKLGVSPDQVFKTYSSTTNNYPEYVYRHFTTLTHYQNIKRKTGLAKMETTNGRPVSIFPVSYLHSNYPAVYKLYAIVVSTIGLKVRAEVRYVYDAQSAGAGFIRNDEARDRTVRRTAYIDRFETGIYR